MPAELPRPGVQVVQVFRTVTPTIVTPTLVPCVVGICRQIVEALKTSASGSKQLNSEAVISVPAVLPAVADGPYAFGGRAFNFSVSDGPAVDVTFSGLAAANMTADKVVSEINARLIEVGNGEVLAETFLFGGVKRWRLRTVGSGEFQSLTVSPTTHTSVLTALGLPVGYEMSGFSFYSQERRTLPQASFPDPRGNIDELAIESDTIKTYLSLGSGALLKEMKRNESMLRRGTLAEAIGTVDTTTLVAATPAVVNGTADITDVALYGVGAATIDGLTVIATVNGVPVTLTFDGLTTSASKVAMLAAFDAAFTTATATQGGSGGNKLVWTSDTLGTGSIINITGGTALVKLGLVVASTAGTNGTLGTKTLIMTVNGVATTVTFAPSLTPGPSAVSAINAVVPTTDAGLIAALTDDDFLRLRAFRPFGADATIIFTGGTGLATLGFTAETITASDSVVAYDDANGDTLTPFVQFLGQDFTASATAAKVRGTIDLTGITFADLEDTTLILSDGGPPQTLTFGTIADETALIAAIDAFFNPGLDSSLDGDDFLLLQSDSVGVEGMVKVVGGTALSILGLTAGTVAYGSGCKPIAGDELYVDGVLLGKITQVGPAGATDVLKLNKQIALTFTGVRWYIQAKNLVSPYTARPTPDMQLDGGDNPIFKQQILRDITGNPISGKAPIYVAYKAIRQDVTALAENPGVLQVSSTSQVSSLLDPISVDNPLALGLYFALLNAPGTSVTGLGVDTISADAPYGTTEAFARAAELLEAVEVYAIAPLSSDPDVGQIWLSHVLAMSEPESKGERIVLFNGKKPTSALDVLVASGTGGQSTGNANEFDTGILNLSALLQAADIDPTGAIDADEGLYLDIAGDALKYSIASISGGIVTLRTSFTVGDNDDDFYTEDAIATTIIEETFAIKVRGAPLVNSDDTPDKPTIAATYQGMGQAYGNRRFWHTMPDKAGATIGGIEQRIEGFYLNCGAVGLIGAQPPQQSATNFPMTGYTRVIGSSDYFTERQLNVIAAGGNYIYVQDVAGGPVISRMALTTDLTSIETRTDSITKVVDFTAKFLRIGLKNFIGRFNITSAFIDSLSHVLQGMLGFLTEAGILIGAQVAQILQDEDAPDTVLIQVELDVPYPCNYIRLTLVI